MSNTSIPPSEPRDDPVVAAVRERYGAIARRVSEGSKGSCGCGTKGAGPDVISSDLYDSGQSRDVPAAALQASLGCGNPTALAELRPGQVVLDLGSGGGIDVLLSAKRVGPTGKAYGLDMTDEMLALARENQRKANVANVEFLKGRIEAVPLPDASVDVVISNCVVALSVDKPRVFAEAFRVLRPGGLLAISDIVARSEVPTEIQRSLEAHLGCFAGALHEPECESLLRDAGFEAVSVTPTRIYSGEDARPIVAEMGRDPSLAERADGLFMSAFLRAHKPLASAPAADRTTPCASTRPLTSTEPCAAPARSDAKLGERVRELIAVGASVTANCQPCLEYHGRAALAAGASRGEISEAVSVGRVVRKGAASKMDAYVAELAGKTQAAPQPSRGCGCDS